MRDNILIKVCVATAILAVSATIAKPAKAELVYDDNKQGQVEERETTREVIRSSERNADRQRETAPEAVRPAAVPQVQVITNNTSSSDAGADASVTAPQTVRTSANADAETTVSRSENLRRERMREELKNEDALQERLEQLRLRDEKRRADRVLSDKDEAAVAPAPVPAPYVMAPAPGQWGPSASAATPPPAAVAPTPPAPVNVTDVTVEEEVVTTPVTEKSNRKKGRHGRRAESEEAIITTDDSYVATSRASTDLSAEDPDKTQIMVVPRFGLANMKNDGSLTVSSKFTAGIGAEIMATENLSFELAYSYAEYGVDAASNYTYYLPTYANSLTFKQNVFEGELKFHLLGRDSKIRPFIGGGAAYSKGFVNYSDDVFSAMRQYGFNLNSPDYEISSFLGVISAGLDVKISKTVSIGGAFKYYNVLSSSGSEKLYVPAYYTGYGPGQGDFTKNNAGGQIAQSGFYSITATAAFSF